MNDYSIHTIIQRKIHGHLNIYIYIYIYIWGGRTYTRVNQKVLNLTLIEEPKLNILN